MVERLIIDDLLHWATNYKVTFSIEVFHHLSLNYSLIRGSYYVFLVDMVSYAY